MLPISEILYCLVIFGVIAAECLLAVWAATSSRPRLLRAIVVWLAIVPLIPIRAYAPALFFAVNAVATSAMIVLVGRILRGPSPAGPDHSSRKFALADLFILTLVAATVIALIMYCRLSVRQILFAAPFCGVLPATVCACAHYAAVGPSRGRAAAAGLVAAALSSTQLLWLNLRQTLEIRLLNGPLPQRHGLLGHLILLACIATSATLVLWLVILIRRRPPQAWKRLLYVLALVLSSSTGILLGCRYIDELWIRGLPMVRHYGADWLTFFATLVGLALVVAVASGTRSGLRQSPIPSWAGDVRFVSPYLAGLLAIPAAWIYWQMLWPGQFPPLAAGGVNHYERLAAIGKEMLEQERRTRGLAYVASVPLLDEATPLLLDGSNHMPASVIEAGLQEQPPWYQYREFLAVAGQLDWQRDRCQDPHQGAQYALALVRLETMFHRGGLPAHATMATSLAASAEQWLADHLEDLSPAQLREIIPVLARSLAERDDPTLMFRRVRIFVERLQGWISRLKAILAEPAPNLPRSANLEQIHAANLSLQSLQVLYAVRLFQHDHGRLPHNLAELTPQYLESAPIDPYSAQPLVYRDHQHWHGLYSVGPDGQDDGGRFIAPPAAGDTGYDLDLSWRNRKRAGP